ncbi:ABC transporter substrate-binding protein [Cupriavidus alkaliphilus]|uniref:ABC transporter substrate-binding protein n=1 Tax=Cupriavidus alkaliphilus TaxID=942866 RepID=UPI0017F1403E|nr:ABC transporter substrate-binding protein [Cupriavidus alkaliphilus]MBB3014106.1 branched-chain amino acid transport system substrate-binding protein [Cupriavidus alkaliphilus]
MNNLTHEGRQRALLPVFAPRSQRRLYGAAMAIALAAGVTPAGAQSANALKIGIMNDASGPYVDLSGPGSVVAARMAIEDFGGKVLGRPVELLVGDHLNKADTALTIARQWYDGGARAIFDIGVAPVAIAVQDLAKQKNRIAVFTSSGSSELTGKYCSPNGIQWVYNTYPQVRSSTRGVLDAGGKKWYFITVDYTYGKSMQNDARKMLERDGASLVGATTHPLAASDFSSQLLQAQSSGAQVIGLATTTVQTSGMIKQADEFGLRAKGQKLAPLSLQLYDVKALGLKAAQDLVLGEAYYWDQNEETRKFALRFKERVGKNRMPNMSQAGTYGAVLHYLKAVAAAGTDDTAAVLASMKSMPINDFMTKNGSIRADGQVMRDFYIFRVKKPAESKGEWDLYAPVATLPRDIAQRPADKDVCNLVK